MNQEFYFVIVNNDKPIYEFPTEDKTRYLKQFIAYSALDIIDELESTSTSMYLKNIDKFNEWTVYAFVPNKLRILLLLSNKITRVDENFFIELYQTYCKFATNPLYIHNTLIKSASFDKKVSQIARSTQVIDWLYSGHFVWNNYIRLANCDDHFRGGFESCCLRLRTCQERAEKALTKLI